MKSLYRPEEAECFIANANKVKFMSRHISGVNSATLSRRFISKSIMVAPGINSGDIRFAGFVKHLAHELNKTFPKSEVDETGLFVGPPVPTDFMELKTEAGSVRSPLGFHKCNEIKDISIMDEAFTELEMLYQNHRDITKHARIVAKTSSGAPYFDVNPSRSLVHLALIGSNFREFVNMVLKDNWTDLYQKYGVMLCNHSQVRLQNDGWKNGSPKSRMIHYFLDVEHGLKHEHESASVLPNGLATCRTRSIVASPKLLNNIGSEIIEPFRKGLESHFSKTYKEITLKDQIRQAQSRKFTIGLDVKNYDSNVSFNLIERLFKALPLSNEGTEFILKFVGDLMYAPLYCSDPYGDGVAMCSGNPLKGRTSVYRGLTSGIFFTSMASKHIFPLYVYSVLKKAGLLKGSLSEFLNWELDVAMTNMGDDTKLMFNNEAILKFVKDGGLNTNIFNVEIEEGVKYCGILSYKDNGDIKCCYNMASYFRFWVAEKDYNSKIHPYKLYGRQLSLAEDMYGSHPYMHKALEIERRVFREHFSADLDVMMRKHMVMPEVNNLDKRDLEIMINPDKLFYKYEIEDIQDELVKDYLYVIPQETSDSIRSIIYN